MEGLFSAERGSCRAEKRIASAALPGILLDGASLIQPTNYSTIFVGRINEVPSAALSGILLDDASLIQPTNYITIFVGRINEVPSAALSGIQMQKTPLKSGVS